LIAVRTHNVEETEFTMKKPRRLFRNRQREADVLIVAEDQERNIILGDPDLADLQGYSKAIRSRWWKAYKEEGIRNPIVVAVPKRSKLARDRGLTEGPDFTFLAVGTHDAASDGWLNPRLADSQNRPPSMRIILATGEKLEVHLLTNLTESGVLDMVFFDAEFRAGLLADHPTLQPYLEAPWTWID
jgi:hypothetical protein